MDNSDLDKKTPTPATKAGLIGDLNKIGKLSVFYSNWFCGNSNLEDGDTQN